MARAARHSSLETRTGRFRLKDQHEPYWAKVREGLYIGYYRPGGTWWMRVKRPGEKRYDKARLAIADDHQDADGREILTFFQAQDAARQRAEDLLAKRDGGEDDAKLQRGQFAVGDAAREYLAWFKAHRKSHRATEVVVDAHILPTFKNVPVEALTASRLRKWHLDLASSPPRTRTKKGEKQRHRDFDAGDPEAVRRRRYTANRVLTVLKALLNYSHTEHPRLVPSDDAWRRVKPFRDVASARIRFLKEVEAIRLLNACPQDLRRLVRAALLCGCRFGELAAMRVGDYLPEARVVHVATSKSGKARNVPLTDAGIAFFEGLVAGRGSSELMFLRADGTSWSKNSYVRSLKAASTRAKLSPPVGFHDLRHAYGSALAMKGVSLQVIAEALGHADTRITSRHYAHLLPSYVAETIRRNLPAFGDTGKAKVTRIRS